MDKLVYWYDSGNKLTKVLDNGNDNYGFKDGTNTNDDFEYDANGNMIIDRNKGITNITYNHLNLPLEIKVDNSDSKKINYTYDAMGTKLRKVINDNGNITTLDYANGYTYENNTLEYFPTAEGYVKKDNTGFKYVYQYKDHLGNVRLSYTDNNNDGIITASSDPNTTEIIEESNYYPFGLKHKGYNGNISSIGNSVAQKWKYNGIEYEETLGLDLYEMDVRSYDPAIARWTSIDPVTHHSFSTYSAFDNNPVFFADPSGADSIYNFETGQYVINGNVVAFDEAMAYANNGGNSDGSNNNTANTDPKKKETYVQKTFRQTLTSFIVNLDNSQNMSLSAPANDKNVNAYQLFYQWIMGAGPSVRNFDEGSIMGQQMLKAPEVMAAIKKAIAQSKAGNYDDVPFARSLGKEVKGSPMAYIKDFYKDVNGRNPARGFHGSFAGRVTINSSLNESNVSLVNLTIIMSDNMTATSGTRSSPLAGGYGKNPIAVYPEPNPYGSRGQFRTIKVNYRMNVNVQSGIKD